MKQLRLLILAALAFGQFSATAAAPTDNVKVQPGTNILISPTATQLFAANPAIAGTPATNVRAYGATGGGTVDDVAFINSAITAAETGTGTVHLFFPPGKYRLATATATATETASGYLLVLGTADLAGRDVVIDGDGATLYADVGTAYVTEFWIHGKFRSLTINGLRVEKSSTARANSGSASEPNNSDGLLISAYDTRRVESITLNRCTFVNCHRSVTLYGHGNNKRNKLASFSMLGCQVLNPYGANVTITPVAPYGGGQQVSTDQWAERTTYDGNTWDGGWSGTADTATCPGGVTKDGGPFDGAKRMVFTGNHLVRHAVEAVLKLPNTVLDTTNPSTGGFTVPAVNGNVAVNISGHSTTLDYDTTFTAAQRVFVQGAGGFEVVSSTSTTLTIKNLTATPAAVIAAGKIIWEDIASDGLAEISGNLIDMTPPIGGYDTGRLAIASNMRTDISGNIIRGSKLGIDIYTGTGSPAQADTRFSTIIGNNLQISDSTADVNYFYGILNDAADVRISGNTITTPTGLRLGGIVTTAARTVIENNSVFVTATVAANGYSSANRAVGVATYAASSVGVAVASGTNPLFTTLAGVPHRYEVGYAITVSGMTGAGSTAANSSWTVASIPSATTFTVGASLVTSGVGTGGTSSSVANTTGTVFRGNNTGGLDVGVGPLVASSSDAATVSGHTDTSSVLPLDTNIANLIRITAPVATGTLATLAGTETLTNKTYKLALAIVDTNGNALLTPAAAGSAVNGLTIGNAATGFPPFLQASGPGTDISFSLRPKGGGNLVFEMASGTVYIGASGSLQLPSYLIMNPIDYAIYNGSDSNTKLSLAGNTWRFGVGGNDRLEVTAAGIVSSGTTTLTGATTLGSTVKLMSYIVSGLPAAATAGAGAMAYVTDATNSAIIGLGLPVVGGGSNKAVAVSDGTNWIEQ